MTEDERTARLYLIAPHAADAVGVDAFEDVLAAADIASVLFPEPTTAFAAHATAAQTAGVAVIVPADADAVFPRDGLHVDGDLTALPALRAANPDAILGFGGVARRHDGMLAAEAGADYVAIGRLLTDDPLPLSEREALLEWWQALMEVPCVCRADAADDVARLVRAGADFIAVGALVWAAEDPATTIAALNDRLAAGLAPA